MISMDAMDKIIEITERNLQMQGEFLRNLMELRARFDTVDRDHKDIGEDIKSALTNSFEIINTMKLAPNEKIISSMEKDRETTTDLYTEFCTMCLKVSDITDNLADSDKWSKRFISIVTAALILIQSGGIYMQRKSDDAADQLRQNILEMVDALGKNVSDGKKGKNKQQED